MSPLKLVFGLALAGAVIYFTYRSYSAPVELTAVQAEQGARTLQNVRDATGRSQALEDRHLRAADQAETTEPR